MFTTHYSYDGARVIVNDTNVTEVTPQNFVV